MENKENCTSCENCFSCMSCGQYHCDPTMHINNSRFPKDCLTTNTTDEDLAEVLELYNDPENHAVMVAAAETESESYGKIIRVEEIMEVARKLGFKKIGIASCAGLIHEAQTLAKILRLHDFEVYGVICKVGAIEKTRVGIPEKCMSTGPAMCNPIMQAKKLNDAGTQLNVVVGLCVGHDSLFYKYSNALCTTLVTKDRVLGHNPAVALYQTNSYYRRLMNTPLIK